MEVLAMLLCVLVTSNCVHLTDLDRETDAVSSSSSVGALLGERNSVGRTAFSLDQRSSDAGRRARNGSDRIMTTAEVLGGLRRFSDSTSSDAKTRTGFRKALEPDTRSSPSNSASSEVARRTYRWGRHRRDSRSLGASLGSVDTEVNVEKKTVEYGTRRRRAYDVNDPFFISLNEFNSFFRKLPIELKYAIAATNHFEGALLLGYATFRGGREEIDKLLSEYIQAKCRERRVLRESMEKAGNASQAMLGDYKSLRPGLSWAYVKLEHNLKSFFAAPSALLTEYDVLKRDEFDSLDSYLAGTDTCDEGEADRKGAAAGGNATSVAAGEVNGTAMAGAVNATAVAAEVKKAEEQEEELMRVKDADTTRSLSASYEAMREVRRRLPPDLQRLIGATDDVENEVIGRYAAGRSVTSPLLSDYYAAKKAERELLKELVSEMDASAAKDLVDAYKTLRKGRVWNYVKLQDRFKSFFRRFSSSLLEFETLKMDELISLDRFLKVPSTSAAAKPPPAAPPASGQPATADDDAKKIVEDDKVAYAALLRTFPASVGDIILHTDSIDWQMLDFHAKSQPVPKTVLDAYKTAVNEERDAVRKVIAEKPDNRTSLIESYKALRKGSVWKFLRTDQRYAEFFKRPSPSLAGYEALRKEELAAIDGNGSLPAAKPKKARHVEKRYAVKTNLKALELERGDTAISNLNTSTPKDLNSNPNQSTRERETSSSNLNMTEALIARLNENRPAPEQEDTWTSKPVDDSQAVLNDSNSTTTNYSDSAAVTANRVFGYVVLFSLAAQVITCIVIIYCYRMRSSGAKLDSEKDHLEPAKTPTATIRPATRTKLMATAMFKSAVRDATTSGYVREFPTTSRPTAKVEHGPLARGPKQVKQPALGAPTVTETSKSSKPTIPEKSNVAVVSEGSKPSKSTLIKKPTAIAVSETITPSNAFILRSSNAGALSDATEQSKPTVLNIPNVATEIEASTPSKPIILGTSTVAPESETSKASKSTSHASVTVTPLSGALKPSSPKYPDTSNVAAAGETLQSSKAIVLGTSTVSPITEASKIQRSTIQGSKTVVSVSEAAKTPTLTVLGTPNIEVPKPPKALLLKGTSPVVPVTEASNSRKPSIEGSTNAAPIPEASETPKPVIQGSTNVAPVTETSKMTKFTSVQGSTTEASRTPNSTIEGSTVIGVITESWKRPETTTQGSTTKASRTPNSSLQASETVSPKTKDSTSGVAVTEASKMSKPALQGSESVGTREAASLSTAIVLDIKTVTPINEVSKTSKSSIQGSTTDIFINETSKMPKPSIQDSTTNVSKSQKSIQSSTTEASKTPNFPVQRSTTVTPINESSKTSKSNIQGTTPIPPISEKPQQSIQGSTIEEASKTTNYPTEGSTVVFSLTQTSKVATTFGATGEASGLSREIVLDTKIVSPINESSNPSKPVVQGLTIVANETQTLRRSRSNIRSTPTVVPARDSLQAKTPPTVRGPSPIFSLARETTPSRTKPLRSFGSISNTAHGRRPSQTSISCPRSRSTCAPTRQTYRTPDFAIGPSPQAASDMALVSSNRSLSAGFSNPAVRKIQRNSFYSACNINGRLHPAGNTETGASNISLSVDSLAARTSGAHLPHQRI